MLNHSQEPAGDAVLHIVTDGPSRTVLIVDDDSGVREVMTRWLEAGGYAVRSASNADTALRQLEESLSAVVLCDIRMPGHDGLWLAEKIRKHYPEIALIMATGVQDVGPAIESLRAGVVDYLTKPFGRDRLRDAVTRGLEWHRSAWDARQWRQTLHDEMQIRRQRLRAALTALEIDSPETLDATLSMLTLSDRDAYSHAGRVAALSITLARAMGVSGAELRTIEHGALLHDVGKLAMPDAILRKPAPLTDEEMSLVRLHPAFAAEIIADVPFLAPAAPVVRHSQERIDGHGYPDGLLGDAIPIGARIVSVTNAFDTMTRPRVFRDAIAASEALLEIDRCSGTQFDKWVVSAFKRIALR